jgi:maleate isomerase
MKLAYDLTTQDRIRLGLIVLQADESLEHDMRRMMPDQVDLLVSRVRSGDEVTTDSLNAMEQALPDAAALFPHEAAFSVIGYGCTSGTAEIGADHVAGLIRSETQAAAVTEPVSALIAACNALGVTRIGLISPYIPQVSDKLCEVLTKAGITVTALASFDEPQERKVVQIAPHSLTGAVTQMAQNASCDAIFLSCTNLRTLDIIESCEAATDLPILSSNQVLAWHMLRCADVAPGGFTPGRLWQVS